MIQGLEASIASSSARGVSADHPREEQLPTIRQTGEAPLQEGAGLRLADGGGRATGSNGLTPKRGAGTINVMASISASLLT
jgi:hypothetical protein